MFGFIAEVLGFLLGDAVGERLFGKGRPASPGATPTAPTQRAPGPDTRVLFRRFCAFFTDLLLVFAACYLLLGFGRLGLSKSLIAASASFLLYRIVFEALFGRTPAKALFRIRVVAGSRPGIDGVGPGRAIARNLLLVADLIFMSWLVGILLPLLTGGNQRLGDLVAGTLVVSERSRARLRKGPAGSRQTHGRARSRGAYGPSHRRPGGS